MADRGRDLKFSILSDLSQLNTDDAARGLDDVGDAAKSAGKNLERLEDDAKGVDLDQLGDAAKDTARKVDDAFDTIARASRQSTSKVDDDLTKSKAGLDDFKSESASTARESAASFSGEFSDVGDAIQETAANAFGGFGPAGAAAGAAAAIGIGFATKAITESRERVKELAGEIIDAGGRITTDGLFARISDAATDGKLEKLSRAARTLGIDASGLQAIFRDSDSARAFVQSLDAIAPAQESVNRTRIDANKIGSVTAETMAKSTALTVEQKVALRDLREATSASVEEFTKAEEVARLYQEVTGHSIETIEAYSDAIAGVTDGSGIMADAVEASATRQAEATKSTEDSWQDYADTALASIDDVIAKQLEQLSAAADFEANTKDVFDRLGQDAVDWALSQGDSADEAMQLLANAPLEKGQQVADNYAKAASQAGAAYADTLAGQSGRVDAAASQIHHSAARILGGRITVPVGLDGRYAMSDAERLRYDIQNQIGTIVVPVRAGQSPYANTADNSRYRD